MAQSALREYEDIRIPVAWGHVEGRWYGNRNVRPILALHGWQDNLGTWNTLIPLLPPHIGILCVDLPGHGRSSQYPKGMIYHMIDYVEIIIRVMKEYNWQKVSLMGHSLGGIVCFIYTTLYARTVDMFITIDIMKPRYHNPDYLVKRYAVNIEKSLVEDERSNRLALYEPPSYTYEQLEQMLYKGSRESVNLENCKHILERSVTKSHKYPDKYYFSRDGRVKFYAEFESEVKLSLEMAKRLLRVPYLVVKSSASHYIGEDSNALIELLQKQHSHFEYHVIEGTHHVHLNNPQGVANVLNPFINHFRPAELNSWAVDDDAMGGVGKTIKSNRKEKSRVKTWKLFCSKL